MTTEELIAARRAEPWREALRKSKKNKERTLMQSWHRKRCRWMRNPAAIPASKR